MRVSTATPIALQQIIFNCLSAKGRGLRLRNLTIWLYIDLMRFDLRHLFGMVQYQINSQFMI